MIIQGAGVSTPENQETLRKELFEQNQFNLLASNLISLQRSLPDVRYLECRPIKYPNRLPSVSVVIVFHNEARSTLLRTIWSVINRSPKELIEEIILVDDVSDQKHLQAPLNEDIKNIPAKVVLIRASKREGATRARLIGAKRAIVMVFCLFLSM